MEYSNDMITLKQRHDGQNKNNLERSRLFLLNVFTSYGEYCRIKP